MSAQPKHINTIRHRVLNWAGCCLVLWASNCNQPQPAPLQSADRSADQSAQAPPPAVATEPPAPADKHSTPAVTIPLAGRDIIVITNVILQNTPIDKAVACRLESEQPETPASQPADHRISTFKILATGKKTPALWLSVVETPTDTTLQIICKSSPLPTVQLIAETTLPFIPVCLQPRESDRILNAAIGPVSGTGFDGLFYAPQDWAVSLAGRVYFEDLGDRVRLAITSGGDQSSYADALTLTHEPGFLKKSHSLTGYVPLDPRRVDPMPAAWMPLDANVALDEIARSTAWMAVNLRPYGAASVLVPDAGIVRPTGVSAARSPSPPNTFSTDYIRQAAMNIVSRFWGQGFVAQSTSSSVTVGEPLPLTCARGFASLLGLAGRSPIASERMNQLADERVELLRRIIPTAPIRAIDLYAHQAWSPIWNLAVNTDAGKWNVLGLFNASDETRTEFIELEDLNLGTGEERFAIYDFWNNRLLRIATNRFSLQVPAGGCRVVRITRINDDRPTIIGTTRHITCGAADLHDVRWNDKALKFTGRSDLAAHDPYEIWLYLPEGNDSLEIKTVSTSAPRSFTRTMGNIRIITLEADSSGAYSWELSFYRHAQPFPAPPHAPRNLQARQNTRGVLLNWYQTDEHAVHYQLYRNHRLVAESEDCEFQDSTALYNTAYEYAVAAINAHGQESLWSDSTHHQTPLPASVNLSQLVPLVVSMENASLGQDRSAAGTPMRVADQRLYRGLGTVAPSRLCYFLGGGYEMFTGVVGIDNRSSGQGAASFRIVADGQTLFSSPLMKVGQASLPFAVRVAGKMKLELIVTEPQDATSPVYADWGNAYLQAAPAATPQTGATQPAHSDPAP